MRTSGDGNSMVVLVVLIDISSLKACVWGGGCACACACACECVRACACVCALTHRVYRGPTLPRDKVDCQHMKRFCTGTKNVSGIPGN